jgi:Ca2+-binding EF-hand superfamily protein
MVAGKLKRKKKKKKNKNKNKGFFDDSYMAKEQKAAEIAKQLKKGDELIEKADAATDAELTEAAACFRAVLDLEPHNIQARVSSKKAALLVERRAEERKAERKKLLMQKRYGDNWATEMGCEQTCTDKDLREVFDLVDVDKGGTLDREEVGTLADFFAEAAMTEEQIDEAMAEMDEDGSGEVDFEEFREWYHSREARKRAKEEEDKKAQEQKQSEKLQRASSVTKKHERTGDVDVDDPAFEEKLRQIFERYDDDGSGEIDAEELGQIFEALGQPMEEDELLQLVEEIDEDGSGMIEFDEFLQMVKSTGGGAAAVLRDQAFGEMDAEERHMWARGKVLRFPNGTFHSVFTKGDYDKLKDLGCLEPGVMSSAEFSEEDPRMTPRSNLERSSSLR